MDEQIADRILDLAMKIQQISSPTFEEGQRAEFVYNHFHTIGANDVAIDDCGNVYTHIKGRDEMPAVIVSAHLDTVFTRSTDLTCTRSMGRILGPGIGDNSLGLAGLFGLYWQFTENEFVFNNLSGPEGDLWLVANVGEEGLGDLRGMKAVVDRFGREPIAYVVLEGMSLGQIYTRGLGVRRYRISVHTRGGHSWVDYGSPSAIHEIADLIVKLKNISIPKEPRASLNIGVITGGTSVNTIAAEASLELDLRSEDSQVLDQLTSQVEALVNEANRMGGDVVRVSAAVIGNRPPGEIPIDHPLVKTAIECFAKEEIKLKLNIGSTDANIPLSRGYPAICVGLTTGAGAHTMGEYIETAPVAQGFKILVEIVRSAFRLETNTPNIGKP